MIEQVGFFLVKCIIILVKKLDELRHEDIMKIFLHQKETSELYSGGGMPSSSHYRLNKLSWQLLS